MSINRDVATAPISTGARASQTASAHALNDDERELAALPWMVRLTATCLITLALG